MRERPLSGAAAHAAAALGFAPGTDASPDGFAVLYGLYWLCAKLSEPAPLLQSDDDAHRADAPSHRYLAYFAPRLHSSP